MKVTKTMQRVAADILTEFMFTRDMNEVVATYNRVLERYGLCEDPSTKCPCTPDEYWDNKLEYEKQVMIERYGHCDGLD